MEKSPQAFRTISEVSETIEVPAHVLRFWESRFTQVRPVKRGGGRRYYRPEDVALLRVIRELLYTEGLTIRGVQKLMKENGAKHLVDKYSGGPVALDVQAQDSGTPAHGVGDGDTVDGGADDGSAADGGVGQDDPAGAVSGEDDTRDDGLFSDDARDDDILPEPTRATGATETETTETEKTDLAAETRRAELRSILDRLEALRGRMAAPGDVPDSE